MALHSTPVAALLATLPRRYWRDLDARWPVTRTAVLSAVLTMALGFAIGVRGYFDYVLPMQDVTGAMMVDSGERHLRADDAMPVATAMAPMALTILGVLAFAFFTPTGQTAVYLLLSGFLRAVSAYVDDPRGDPILTGIDTVARKTSQRLHRRARERARERQEGPPTPDRLLTGEAAGLPEFEVVVVASRRKAGWEPGAIVVTLAHWYRIGRPFDRRFPEGLRTMYPLQRLKTVEVLRKYVAYELPSIEEGSSQS